MLTGPSPSYHDPSIAVPPSRPVCRVHHRLLEFTLLALLLVALAAGCTDQPPVPDLPDGATAAAAGPEAVAVLAVVDQLFDGMRTSDSTQVRAVLHPDATFRTVVRDSAGMTLLREGSPEAFVAAVGQPKPEGQIWDERIWDPVVLVDGPMATAWTPYAFYLGDSFSHCGVNAFQLIDTDAGWRILAITDTRQREGCEIPDGV